MTSNRFNKVYNNASTSIFDLSDGARLMFGGFGLSGNAENCITAVAQSGKKNFTIISNNCGNQRKGLAVLLQNRQISKVICSFVGGNPDLEEQMLKNEVSVELNPQGTFAERIRAGGAGLGGFFTPTGVGTVVAEGKEERLIDGKRMILETPLKADFAFVRAQVGDIYGNLRFYRTSRNFSMAMAMAAKVTIAEVETLVEEGQLDPDDIHLPGVFVKRIFVGTNHQNVIEHLMTRAA